MNKKIKTLYTLATLITLSAFAACTGKAATNEAEIAGITGEPISEATQAPSSESAETTAPITPTDTPIPTDTPTPTVPAREYDMSKYTKAANYDNGTNIVSFDVSEMNTRGVNADFRLTARFTDKTYEEKILKAENGVVSTDFDKTVEAAEISVIYKFSLGKDSHTEEEGYIKVPWTAKYDASASEGFEGNIDVDPKGVRLRSADYCFVAALPDGLYDVTVKKIEQARSTLCINGGAFGVNVGIVGTDRKGSDLLFSAQDIAVTGGEARFSMIGDTSVSYIEFSRVPSIIERKPHIYIAGDSTVATYYPREFTKQEPAAGTAQTGWGQLFSRYTTDDVIVDALGAGGTYAKSWYEMYFQGIINNARPGDYFIIQEGINDRTYSSVEEMKEYLSLMIDKCREMDVVPVLVTSQQTAKFWKKADGTDAGDFEAPEGSGLYPFAEGIRELAKEKKVFLIDNAAITSKWYSKVGREYVEKTYHLYDTKNDKSVDSLHSAYAGSKKISALIATEIGRKIEAKETDGLGNTLSGILLNPITEYEFSYINETGESVTEMITEIKFRE